MFVTFKGERYWAIVHRELWEEKHFLFCDPRIPQNVMFLDG